MKTIEEIFDSLDVATGWTLETKYNLLRGYFEYFCRDKIDSFDKEMTRLAGHGSEVEVVVDGESFAFECDHCGLVKDDVIYVANPYTQDISGKIEEEFICTDCYKILCDDI